MTRTLRVAAAQFPVGTDVDANLATTCEMIEAAADEGAELVVTPEFCNHLSIYDDAAHAWQVAIDVDGEWPERISEIAERRGVWVQFNATVRRTPATDTEPRARITNTNFVIDPTGRVAAVTDKTVLMGAEGDHLSPADTAPTLADGPLGAIGSYACMDGIVPEVPRAVAAGGARLLLNSLNSFALDEASLHIPVRAAENRSWVVACCKVGPLLPPEKVELFSSMMGVPGDMLSGAGESQIVAPDGTVVAKGPREGAAVVLAEIDLDRRGELRPDGTDVWTSRRPELYGPLAATTPPLDDHPRADSLDVAVGETADDIAGLVAAGARLIVLPELALELDALGSVTTALGDTGALVVSSVRDGAAHVGVVVGADGVLARQGQLHHVARHDWATDLGDGVTTVDLPWGRLAVIVGDDLVYPEVSRLAALASVDVLAVPMDAQEPWETTLGVPERAAENRMCVVAATPATSAGVSTIADLPPDFTLWAPSRERDFDGTINQPDLTTLTPGSTAVVGSVHPARTVNRQISKGTNLVDGRPWRICGSLLD